MKSKSRIASLIVLINLFLVTGCEGRDSFVEELEVAEQNAYKQKSIASEEVYVAASHVAQKYFPLGMKKTELLKVLNEFYKNGYEVLELKHEGTRLWPSKEFRHYPNVNRQKKYPAGTEGYVLKKQYDTANFLIAQTAVVSVKLNGAIVVESKSHINTNGI